jgi:hypothetical protein
LEGKRPAESGSGTERLPLAEGETLLSDFAASLGPEQSDYIRASIAESLQQQRQRQQLAVVTFNVIALLAVGATSFAIFGFWQKSEAEKAASRAYVSLARNSVQAAKMLKLWRTWLRRCA